MDQFMEKIKAIISNTEDTTSRYDPQDIESNRWQGWLSYLSMLCLIPLFMNMFGTKRSEYGLYHAKQGLTLAVFELVAGILMDLLNDIFLIKLIFVIAGWLINAAACILSIIGIVNVCNGKAKELPFIGKIKIIK